MAKQPNDNTELHRSAVLLQHKVMDLVSNHSKFIYKTKEIQHGRPVITGYKNQQVMCFLELHVD